MDLFIVKYDQENKAFNSHLIDSVEGSSNARIRHTEDGDVIISANRQIDQVAIYK